MELYNMKTAIEWLANELLREHPILTNHDAIKKAKEMEKQQIIDAYENGYSDSDNTFQLNKQYYNETFNK